MSDDEVEMTGATSVAAAHRNLDRRTPRFSWNQAFEETFFRSLCESMHMGYKENHSFKAGAWERAAIALRDKHGAYPEKSHLINKADNARKKFRMWRGLREDPDFLYNPNTRTVTASEEAWKRHFEREPLSKALRGRPFEHEEYMEILFPDVIGSGGAPKRIMKPRRRNADGTPISNSKQNANNSVSGVASAPPATSQSAPIDPLLDSNPNPYADTPTRQPQSANSNSAAYQTGTGSRTSTMPSLSSITPGANSSSALTPPDEQTPQNASIARKRTHPDPASTGRPEKRRGRPSRFSAEFYENRTPSGTAPASQSHMQSHLSSFTTSSFMPPARNTNSSSAAASRSGAIHPSFHGGGGGGAQLVVEEGLLALADALRARSPPKWQEQAVDILFRDFEAEDADLQLKIAEKALMDENKAMVFVKMTPALRKHWVGRLREMHLRNLSGGLGRVGDETS